MTRIAQRYRTFAQYEARGVSPLYEAMSQAVSGHEQLLELLAQLPEPKRQPNLLYAAYRLVCGVPKDAETFVQSAVLQWPLLRLQMLARSTQTNEPARCAVLLPVLAQLPEPLALIEVGASAGLCLLPDHYGYDYGQTRLTPHAVTNGIDYPVFPCKIEGGVPLPPRIPQVVWRAGLDLNPLPIDDADAVAWLKALVWPEQVERAARLSQAIEVARRNPPSVQRGDLRSDLRALVEQAPRDSTVVVMHTAVLAYVASKEDRAAFEQQIRELGVRWISNESAGVFPSIARKAGRTLPAERFLLALDGEPVALTGPHGQSVRWLR